MKNKIRERLIKELKNSYESTTETPETTAWNQGYIAGQMISALGMRDRIMAHMLAYIHGLNVGLGYRPECKVRRDK